MFQIPVLLLKKPCDFRQLFLVGPSKITTTCFLQNFCYRCWRYNCIHTKNKIKLFWRYTAWPHILFCSCGIGGTFPQLSSDRGNPVQSPGPSRGHKPQNFDESQFVSTFKTSHLFPPTLHFVSTRVMSRSKLSSCSTLQSHIENGDVPYHEDTRYKTFY